MNIKKLTDVRTVALVGVMAATLECGKLVLSFLPNVEIVSILTALYGYVFGAAGVIAAFIFVCIEPLIWGFGPWFITYLIYWPSLAVVFMLLGRWEVKNKYALTGIALGMTLSFGVISSVIDSALYLGLNEYYFKNLPIYYIRGMNFYIAQIVCNLVLFSAFFAPLSRRLRLIKSKLKPV